MDWNLKVPFSFNFSQVVEEGSSSSFPNLETVDNGNYEKGGFSVDLKLGRHHHHHHHHHDHVGNSTSTSTSSGNELVDMWRNQTGVSKVTPSSSSGSFKKSRGKVSGSQMVSCLVDGCKSDLSSCRDYHRRHKVCELHSKTPQVTIAGHKQRFCQQCSRFHSLEEFDEDKRSCRKRLDGHNRRRRKPQPDSFSRSASLLHSTYQGTHMLPFSNPIAYSSTSPNVINPSWSRGVTTVKAEPESCTIQNQQNMFLIGSPNSTSNCYEGVKQHFTLMQNNNNNNQTSLGISVCQQPFLRSISSGGNRNKMFCDNLSTTQIHKDHDSDCVLSLLSSPLIQTTTANQIGFRQIMQQHSNPISIGHSLGPLDLNGNRFHPINSVFADESQAGDDAPQTLPFHWD